MSRNSILFLNNPLAFADKASPKHKQKISSPKGTHLSLNSDDSESTSSLEDNISSSQTLDDEQEDFHEDFPDSPRKKSRAERKPHVIKFLKYLQDYKKSPDGTDRILLLNHVVSRDKNEVGQSWSLNNLEGMIGGRAMKAEHKENHESFPSKDENQLLKEDHIHLRKHKKIPLISQFRRKSCHCSDCGGKSKFELKVQDIFSAHNKQMKANRRIRKKLEQKKTNNGTNPFLGLPNFHTMILGDNENQEESQVVKSFTNMRRSIQKKGTAGGLFSNLINSTLINPRLAKLKRGFSSTMIGSETPLRHSQHRGSIEIQLFDAVVKDGPDRDHTEHYMIKIYTPAETEKAIQDEVKKEVVVKKATEILSPVRVSQLNKKIKKKKEPVAKATKKPKVKYVEQSLSSIPEDGFSPYRGGFITSITKLEAIKEEESTRPKVLVKMFSAAKREESSISETSPPRTPTVGKLTALKLEECSVVSNTSPSGTTGTGAVSMAPIQKDLWKPVSLISPKFKSTFAPKIDQEFKATEAAAAGGNNMNQQNDQLGSRNKVPKIYMTQNNNQKNLPKLKIPHQFDMMKSNSLGTPYQGHSPRIPTEPLSSQLQREVSSPLLLNAKSERLMYTTETENSPKEALSSARSMIGNSPYAFSSLSRKNSSSRGIMQTRTMTNPVIKLNTEPSTPNIPSSPTFQESKFKPKIEIGSKTLRLKNLSLDGSRGVGLNAINSPRIVNKNTGKSNFGANGNNGGSGGILPQISPRKDVILQSPRAALGTANSTRTATKKEFLIKLSETKLNLY